MKRALILSFCTCLLAACGDSPAGSTAEGADTQHGTGGGDTGSEQPGTLGAALEMDDGGIDQPGDIEVTVTHTGAVAVVELLVGDKAAASTDQPGKGSTKLTWKAEADGTFELRARVADGAGNEAFSEVVTFTIDGTKPTAELAVKPEGMSSIVVVSGQHELLLAVGGKDLAKVRVANEEATQVANVAAADLVWKTADGAEVLAVIMDTTLLSDGFHHLFVELTDLAGNKGALGSPLKVVVANNGEEVPVEYIPYAKAYVPPNYATTEYHTRIHTDMKANVARVVAWVNWDPTGDWTMEFAVGEGICPHNGTKFVSEESDSGEIVIDITPSDLPATALAKFPAELKGKGVFPVNDVPQTWGKFFGHIAPMDPADHVNQEKPIEVHIVFLYADEG